MIGPFVGLNGNTLAGSASVTALTLSGQLVVTGSIAPAALGGSVNDYNPTGLATTNLIRQDASIASTLTGLLAQVSGQEIVIENTSATNSIVLTNEDVSSAAANRFTLPNGVNWIIPPEGAIWLRYSGSVARWKPVATGNAAGVFQNLLTTTLHATGAATLDSTVSAAGITNSAALALSAKITPTAFGGTQVNDYAPTGLATTYVIDQQATSNTIITGLTAQPPGTQIDFRNIDTSTATITLSHNDAGSLAANRIMLPGGVSWTLPIGSSVLFRYTGSDWRVVSLSTTTFPIFTLSGALIVTGSIAPTALSGTSNDYNPTGLSTTTLIRQDASSASALTGLTAQAGGQEMVVENISGTFSITLTNEDSGSVAANRFTLPNAASWIIPPGGAIWFRYSGATSRWRPVSTNNAAGTFQTLHATGAATLDSTLSAVGVTNSGTLIDTSRINPTGLTGTLPDWAPTSFPARYVLMTTSGTTTISGLAGGVDGMVVTLVPDSANGQTLTITHQDLGSVAANRFKLTGVSSFVAPASTISTLTVRYDGTASRWIEISRSSTRSDYTLSIAGSLQLATSQADTSIGTNDNYALTAGVTVFRWNGASAMVLDGLTGGFSGRLLVIENVATTAGNTLTLVNEASGSTAANRFTLPGGGSYIIQTGESCTICYDSTSTRWRPISGHATQLVSLTPAQITAGQNDYNPSGLSGADIIYQDLDAGRSITGLAGGIDGRRITIVNISTSTLTLSTESGSSSAANRFTGNSSVALSGASPNNISSAMYVYSGTKSRWVPVSAYSAISSYTPFLSNGITINAGHIKANGTSPGIVSGSGATVTGSDVAFTFNTGSGAGGLSAAITFAATYTTSPTVIITSEGGAVPVYTVSATGLVVTTIASTNYHCIVIGH